MKRVIVVLLLVGAVFYFLQKKNSEVPPTETSQTSPTGGPNETAPAAGTTGPTGDQSVGQAQPGQTNPGQVEQPGQAQQAGQPQQPGEAPQAGQGQPAGQEQQAGQTTQEGHPSKVGQTSGNQEPTARTNHIGQPGQSAQVGQEAQPDQAGESEQGAAPVIPYAPKPPRVATGSQSTATGGFSEKPLSKTTDEQRVAAIPAGKGASIQAGGFNTQKGDDGEGMVQPTGKGAKAPSEPPKPQAATSAYGVKEPKVWLLASDLRLVPGASRTFEIGAPEGSKKTPWRNRAGGKLGDGVRVASNASGTFIRDFAIHGGKYDAVEFCSPGSKDCLNAQPSQIKSGLDMNNSEHWLSGPDKVGKSEKGGGSFTVLFVAARGTANPNPLLEHQNGEANAKKGPFLGWIGPDLVGSIHGSQGIVSISAVAVPNSWTEGAPIKPEIYSLRFDRKKSELRLFALGEKVSESKAVQIKKGDGPDNDQYAAIAIGSKTPGDAAVTYVFEHLAFARALGNRELCTIHKEWNKKYGLKIAESDLKPCGGE